MFSIITATIVATAAFALDVDVARTAPASIKYGETLPVVIFVTNNLDNDINATIKEGIGNAKAISPELATQKYVSGIIAAAPPQFVWTISVNAHSKNNVTYIIQPNKVGDYIFSPTRITTGDGKQYSTPVIITTVRCNQNKICEATIGEDEINCAIDCKLAVPVVPPEDTPVAPMPATPGKDSKNVTGGVNDNNGASNTNNTQLPTSPANNMNYLWIALGAGLLLIIVGIIVGHTIKSVGGGEQQ